MAGVIRELFGEQGPDAVLFDLDGTLVDSVPDLAWAIDRMLMELEREPVGEDRVRNWVGNGAQQLVRRALAGVYDGAELEAVDERLLERALAIFLGHYAGHCVVSTQAYPGTVATLARLHKLNVPLICVTNKPQRFAESILQKMGLAGYFRIVVGGDRLPQKKPSPEPLMFACHELAARPRECLMVGDSKTDIVAARSAGMAVVCVSYGYNHGVPIEQHKPDYIVHSLLQLVDTTTELV